MPYFVTNEGQHPDCSGFGVVKDDFELMGCHETKQDAVDQMIAISLAEGVEPGGTFTGQVRDSQDGQALSDTQEDRAPVAGKDKFTTKAEALAKAKQLGCEGTHTMDEDGQTIYMPCSTHAAYDNLTKKPSAPAPSGSGYRNEPAPAKDQITGSDKNEPGSAKGAGGDIKLDERTETALRNKVSTHNEAMKEAGKPPHTRTTYGQLAAVYRRGAGAFSVSHRPGMTRGQWAMARVNAYLYLLRNGRPSNPKYITDNDLLPSGHPKSTRSEDVELESRDAGLRTPAIIIDIDRTLFRNGGINEELVSYLETFENTAVIIITGRVEARRAKTVEELMLFDYDQLIMRASAEDEVVPYKEAEAHHLMDNYNIMIAIDDNTQVLAAYRSLGITSILPSEIPATPEAREVNLTPPAYMRAAARRGLELHAEGKGGDGLVDRTIREARAMASGSVTADKWVRTVAWISRHLVDLDSPAANPESDDYPSPGVVAHLLWGSGPSKRAAQRALEYAEGVVARIEAENEGRAKGEALSKIETRVNTTELEIREEPNGMTFSGYAAVFDSPSEPLPFIERIQRGAFRKSLKSRNDVKFLYNHDSGEILGSTRAKTLSLYEDERGLKVEGTLPNTSRGRDVAELLRRGDLDSMSFGFSVPSGGDTWSADGSERTLKSVRLLEVSLVAFPAYQGTAGLQSVRGLDKAAQRADVDADSLADALLKIEDGLDITAEEKSMLAQVLESLGPEAEPIPAPELSEGMLLLKKKKLELLMKGL